jgi:hypothetical protein
MFSPKTLARNIALAGALPLLVASSAFAQSRTYPGTYQRVANGGYANRTVEGTIASIAAARNGERIRLTNGMDLIVPNSLYGVNQGRRYNASMLQRGDVVRMSVWSRQGDGRDAQVRSLEILQRYGSNNGNRGYNNNGNRGYNDRLITGTVVSFDRRANMLVVQTDNGRTVNVDVNQYGGNRNAFRRGERVNISGRMDRGSFIADGVNR